MSNISRRNVAAVVFDNDGKVLLCKRALYKKIAPGIWHLPGGKIDEGESQIEAITRELHEELSLSVVSAVETPIVFTYTSGDEVHQTHFLHVSVTVTRC